MDMSIQEEPIDTNARSTTKGKKEKKNVSFLLLASVVTIILIGAFTSFYVMIFRLRISVQDLKGQIMQKEYKDINECTSGTHNCHQHATCINTVGSFQCSCNANYTGNGRQCRPNFCSANVGLCKNNGTCLNTSTGYNCSCNIWHSGNHCEQEHDHVIMTTKRNWENARRYCKSIGGDLATWGMRNATVRNWIVTNMIETRPPGYYWIGLNDLEREGVWKYIDGVPVTNANTDFHQGEPNNSGDCGQLYYVQDFAMDDYPCFINKLAICEK